MGAASIIWRAAVNKGNMFNRVKASSTRAFVTWLGLAIVLVAIDQLTKQLIVRSMSPFDFKEILPFLALVFTLNPGAAFSFLADASGWQRWFLTIVAIFAVVLLLTMLHRNSKDSFMSLGLVLILSGAIGNLTDRIMVGAVIDFILIHWHDFRWPAFNVADSCISVGAIILLFDGIFRKRSRPS